MLMAQSTFLTLLQLPEALGQSLPAVDISFCEPAPFSYHQRKLVGPGRPNQGRWVQGPFSREEPSVRQEQSRQRNRNEHCLQNENRIALLQCVNDELSCENTCWRDQKTYQAHFSLLLTPRGA